MKSIKYAAIAYIFVGSMSSYAMEKEAEKPADNTATSSTVNTPTVESRYPGYRGAASPVAITAALNIPKNKKSDSEDATEANNDTPTAGKSYDEGVYFPCGNVFYGRGYYSNDTDSGYDQ